MLADGAKRLGTGHLDHRLEAQSADEFGAMVEAFNTLAGDLSASQRTLVRSRETWSTRPAKLSAADATSRPFWNGLPLAWCRSMRRVVSARVNAAAARLLDLAATVVGQPAATVFERPDLAPLGSMLRDARRGVLAPTVREVSLARDGRECHLAVAATSLPGEHELDGVVMVFDDVTPLFRAQRVAAWRDVARRLAHEIKNPLTPIQLCAERLRRNLAGAPAQAKALVDECTRHHRWRGGGPERVGRRVLALRAPAISPGRPGRSQRVVGETLTLYDGLFEGITLQRAFQAALPSVRVDPDQIQRVVVNLIDNAVAALEGRTGGVPAAIRVETRLDATNGVARVIVSDNGPGISEEDREKLFLPYFSTKGRGSGLGLAIVRRIVIEHGGSIEVTDNVPSGTQFTVELPCAHESSPGDPSGAAAVGRGDA